MLLSRASQPPPEWFPGPPERQLEVFPIRRPSWLGLGCVTMCRQVMHYLLDPKVWRGSPQARGECRSVQVLVATGLRAHGPPVTRRCAEVALAGILGEDSPVLP